MITRIEIDGFKSFERFELALPPFAVIFGVNAVGKSNLFDALRLLSNLATMDVRSAMQDLRGEPPEMFRRTVDGKPAERMTFAVETLLDPKGRDPYGQDLRLTCTRIRYEVTIQRRRSQGIDRMFVIEERANRIRSEEDRWLPNGQKLSKPFADAFIKRRRSTPFIDTQASNSDQPQFTVHQDGHQGRVRHIPAHSAERTVLSSVTTAEFRHLYALRDELGSLRYLQLDPAAERRPSGLDVPDMLLPDGSNLAAVLYRIQAETAMPTEPKGAITDVLADLSEIVPGVINLNVVRDEQRREYRLDIKVRDGLELSSRVVSDGTLRVLALMTLLHDPTQRGVICFEEPENGVHKRRLQSLIRKLKDACADPHAAEVDQDAPLLQMIVNSHSPVVAQTVRDELILAEMVDSFDPTRSGVTRRTMMRSVCLSEQAELDLGDAPRAVTASELDRIVSVEDPSEFAA
jgi:predicted ATPase